MKSYQADAEFQETKETTKKIDDLPESQSIRALENIILLPCGHLDDKEILKQISKKSSKPIHCAQCKHAGEIFRSAFCNPEYSYIDRLQRVYLNNAANINELLRNIRCLKDKNSKLQTILDFYKDQLELLKKGTEFTKGHFTQSMRILRFLIEARKQIRREIGMSWTGPDKDTKFFVSKNSKYIEKPWPSLNAVGRKILIAEAKIRQLSIEYKANMTREIKNFDPIVADSFKQSETILQLTLEFQKILYVSSKELREIKESKETQEISRRFRKASSLDRLFIELIQKIILEIRGDLIWLENRDVFVPLPKIFETKAELQIEAKNAIIFTDEKSTGNHSKNIVMSPPISAVDLEPLTSKDCALYSQCGHVDRISNLILLDKCPICRNPTEKQMRTCIDLSNYAELPRFVSELKEEAEKADKLKIEINKIEIEILQLKKNDKKYLNGVMFFDLAANYKMKSLTVAEQYKLKESVARQSAAIFLPLLTQIKRSVQKPSDQNALFEELDKIRDTELLTLEGFNRIEKLVSNGADLTKYKFVQDRDKLIKNLSDECALDLVVKLLGNRFLFSHKDFENRLCEFIEFLIKYFSINQRCFGETLVYWAVYYKRPIFVSFLLTKGADPQLKGDRNETSLELLTRTVTIEGYHSEDMLILDMLTLFANDEKKMDIAQTRPKYS